LHPARDRIVELAIVLLDADAQPVEEWTTLVDPETTTLGSRIHGITSSDLVDAPTFRGVVQDLLARLAGRVIVAHNAPFDVAFLQAETVRAGIAWGPIEGLCTMEVLHGLRLTHSRQLHLCCSELGLFAGRAHDALDDARAVAGILEFLGPRLWTIDMPPTVPDWAYPAVPARLQPRGVNAAPPAPMSLVRHIRVPPGLGISEAAASTYLALLDHILEDGRVTASEVDALSLFAHACGINRPIARQLHLAYLEEMSRLVRADGLVTPEERLYLSTLTPLLSAALPR
jgi:DNA polymerase-3 subunit epsilon